MGFGNHVVHSRAAYPAVHFGTNESDLIRATIGWVLTTQHVGSVERNHFLQ